jgi:hypothetical protein
LVFGHFAQADCVNGLEPRDITRIHLIENDGNHFHGGHIVLNGHIEYAASKFNDSYLYSNEYVRPGYQGMISEITDGCFRSKKILTVNCIYELPKGCSFFTGEVYNYLDDSRVACECDRTGSRNNPPL